MCLRKQELDRQLEDSPERVRIGETPSSEPSETPERKQEFSSCSAQKETGAPGTGSGVCCTHLAEPLAVRLWKGLLWGGAPTPTL